MSPKKRALTAAALLALGVGTVLTVAPAQAHRPPAHPEQRAQQDQDGVWRTDGYGTLLAIRDGVLREYQTTAVSCLPGATAQRTDPGRDADRDGGSGGGSTRNGDTGGGDGSGVTYLGDDGETRTVRTGPGGDRGQLAFEGSPGHRDLRRVAELPESCGQAVPDDPRATFDVLWQTFAEQYPFFAAKGVDWEAARERHRPTIDADTTDDELFAVFQEMLDPLDDAHVTLTDGGDRFFGETRPGTRVPTPDLDQKVTELVEERDLGGRRLTQYAQGRIGYADLPNGQGYLRISGFAGYSEQGDHRSDAAALDRALDAILTQERTDRLQGLVVDLRVNGGGSDALGLRLAGRLTDRPHFAYAKAARNDPADPDRFTRPQPQQVRPADGVPRYTGPLVVLTGGSTLSAGETFTQALMDRPGFTLRIGEPTQGVFSDVLERTLPGGWQLGLPNEEFRTRDGRTFDGAGIPPDLTEPVFTEEEFAERRDSAFDRAVAELDARTTVSGRR